MPPDAPNQRTIDLPPPGYPLVTRVISNQPFTSSAEPLVWIIGRPHPFEDGMMVVRMFIVDDGVEVYSHNSKNGIRNRIPVSTIRLTEEVMMSLEQFAQEMADAEEAEEEEDDDDLEPELDPEPEDAPVPPVAPPSSVTTPNGQA